MDKNLQKNSLTKILDELDNKFLSRELIKARFLAKRDISDTDIINRLDLIDAVRENLKTALQFNHFRRANRYLAMLDYLCDKFLK